MKNKLKILSISAEVDPFSKAGGVGDVGRSLPKALTRLGHEVIIITPLYGFIDLKKSKLELVAKNVPLSQNTKTDKPFKVNFYRGWLMDGLPVYFVDHGTYFRRYQKIYGTGNDNERFYLLNLAAFALCELLTFKPNILHCHDWQAGLAPDLLRHSFKKSELFAKTATLYTIHNLAFQMEKNWWEAKNSHKDDPNSTLPLLKDKKRVSNINFAKRAIINADIINTVSEKYAEEVLTKSYGEDLQRILQNRQDRFFGIINGIDYFDYNPNTDPGLKKNYRSDNIEARKNNKLYLQKKFKLPVNEKTPLLAMVSRVTEQKGFDLLIDLLNQLMRMDLQLIIWGGGDKRYETVFKKTMKQYPKKFAANLKLTTKNVTQVYAGSDIFLMPSRFEPCGLGQLISLRYGSVPVVHGVGGLLDTVTEYSPRTQRGNGFVFKAYSVQSFLMAIGRALEAYRRPKEWKNLVQQGMKTSSSWEIPAQKYVQLYKIAIKRAKKYK